MSVYLLFAASDPHPKFVGSFSSRKAALLEHGSLKLPGEPLINAISMPDDAERITQLCFIPAEHGNDGVVSHESGLLVLTSLGRVFSVMGRPGVKSNFTLSDVVNWTPPTEHNDDDPSPYGNVRMGPEVRRR